MRKLDILGGILGDNFCGLELLVSKTVSLSSFVYIIMSTRRRFRAFAAQVLLYFIESIQELRNLEDRLGGDLASTTAEAPADL